MTNEREHVSFEMLNDYVDGILDEPTNALIGSHIDACSECAIQHSELRELLGATAQLPRSVLPDEALWVELRASLDRSKDVVLPLPPPGAVRGAAERHTRARWQSPKLLAAAAAVLVLASSSITAVVLRLPDGQKDVSSYSGGIGAPQVGPIVPIVLPSSFRTTEGQYNQAIDELVQAVDAQRSQLNPETIRTVDRSLAVIDSAIAEARAALIADPSNATLIDLLSATYQRKLDLLRRTSELSSRT